MKHFFLAITAIFFGINTTALAQSIEKTWQFEAIQNEAGVHLYNINASDTLELKNAEFNYSVEAMDSVPYSGDYIFQNNLLVFYYDQPNEDVKRFKISELTDSTLVFTEKNTDRGSRRSKKQKSPPAGW